MKYLNRYGLGWGYVKSALTRTKRLEDPAFRKFLRQYQWDCLLKGKKRATEDLNKRQEAKWDSEKSPGWAIDL